MIFTVIGVVIRCLAHYLFKGEGIGNTIGFVLFLIMSALGLYETFLERYEKHPAATIAKFVVQIAATVYFTFFVSSIVSTIIAGVVILLIIGALSDGKETSSCGVSSDNGWDEFISDMNEAQAKQSEYMEQHHNRYEQEKQDREQYVRNNWNSNLGMLNSDASCYQTDDGEWLKISRDGKRYEDKNGNGHSI